MLTYFRFAEEQGVEGYKMWPGCATPDHTIIKEILHRYNHSERGTKSKAGRPVMTMVHNCAKRPFSGFEEKLQTIVVMEDRIEIFKVSYLVALTCYILD